MALRLAAESVVKKEFSFIGLTFPLDVMGELLANFGMTSHQRIQLMKLAELISQNWVLIRQNELIIRLLERTSKNISKKS